MKIRTTNNFSEAMAVMDLGMFSPTMVDYINTWMPEEFKLSGKPRIGMGAGRALLEVETSITNDNGDDVTSIAQVPIRDKESQKYISTIIATAKLFRNALTSASWQFVELMTMKFSPAIAEGEIQIGQELTDDMIVDQMGDADFIAYTREYVQRWCSKGVVCNTDVLVKKQLLINYDQGRQLPTVYPVQVVGKYLIFNQPFPMPHVVVNYKFDDAVNGPQVVGATIYESLGVADVTQRGPEADVVYAGERYIADLSGMRKV